MSQKWVKTLVALMSVVLVGLISIQVYWIKSAIALKKQEFERSVQKAIMSVANNLEKREAENYFFGDLSTPSQLVAQKPVRRNSKRVSNRKLGKNLNEWMAEVEEEMLHMERAFFGNASSGMPEVRLEYDTVIMGGNGDDLSCRNKISICIGNALFEMEVEAPSEEELKQSVQAQVQKIHHRKNVAEDVFFKFFSTERSLYDRIDESMIEGMIKQELKKQGITTQFNFLVTDNFGHVAQSVNFDPHQTQPDNRVPLFANDMFTGPNYLYLYFPSKKNYIVKSLGVMSFSSMGLILIISLVFASAINVILQQKKLSDMKTDFINNMTHELKTPVSTISLASEMLQNSGVAEDKEKVSRYADIIYEENKRLGGQVEKVLQIAVLDKGDVSLNKTSQNFHNLIKQAISKLGLQLENSDAKVDLNLNASQDKLYLDEIHITNIIMNLVDNAVKYSSEKPQLTITTQDAGNGVLLSVSDKGIGMSKEDQRRVFEKFYRVPTGNIHDVKGFGLGLSYVKAMVDAHGGTISVKSEVGRGSTFEIYLPTKSASNG